MASNVNLKAIGLNFSPNNLSLPDGSLEEASNVIIKRDNIIEKRRGFKLYGESFGSSTQRAKQLLHYRDILIRHFGTTLEFDDNTGNFTPFSGSYEQPDVNTKIHSIAANNNLYFTTSEGVKKLSSFTQSFSPTDITNAGGVKAIDISASYIYEPGLTTGFLPINSTVAYRVVWGTRDANNNLILGAPSSRYELYVPAEPIIIQDMLRTLLALDNAAANPGTGTLTDTDYLNTLKLPINASADQIRTNLISLITKLDNDLGYADQVAVAPLQLGATPVTIDNGIATVTFSSGDPSDYVSIGSKIFLSGFTVNDRVNTFDSTADVNTTTDRITITNHQFVQDDTAVFTGTLPTGIVSGTTYYIINPTTNNFQISVTPGGAPVDITAAAVGTGTVTVTQRGGQINGSQVVTSVNSTTLTFSTASFGDVTTSTATINSYSYRGITQPPVPQTPAVGSDLTILQTYLEDIIRQLQSEPNEVINTANLNDFIIPLDITRTVNVQVNVNIPQAVIDAGLNKYFFQIYRSPNMTVTDETVLSDLTPSDELRLAYEAFPTQAELNAKLAIVIDIVPESFLGANLYTNESTGEGILQANDIPPFAKDINRFKNVVFYANTKTRHRKSITLLGVSQLIDLYNSGTIPKFTITNGTQTDTYSFVTGLQEITDITCVADVADSLNGTYFIIYSALDEKKYYFYYKTSGGADTPPVVTDGPIVQILIDTGDTANTVAQRTRDVMNVYAEDFSVADNTLPVIRATNVGYGATTDASAATSGFTVTVFQQGRGEDVSLNQVLLSSVVSPAQALDETARSLVRLINLNASSPVYAYYLSSSNTLPGGILLESKALNQSPFYLLTNNSTTGSSFNPDLSPIHLATAISVANPTQITSVAHGLITGDQVVISSSDSTPSIDGIYTITKVDNDNFTIPVNVTIAGTFAAFSKISDVEVSEDETKGNRIYYSKIDEPESVPVLNYFDVGASDKVILRIYPLRDSLFVFKEDGLYRISGESAPFNLALFDSSCILISVDSVSPCGNLIYAWTKKGIETVSENGVITISRPIDTQILPIGSNNFPNFKSTTFGIGYESDNSYLVWTIQKTSDLYPTICYRYSNLTNSWTNYAKTNTCATTKPDDDLLYLGAGDINYIEQERKTFSRLDYADREHIKQLNNDKYFDNILIVDNTDNISIGDSIIQDQTVTVYNFNMLLKKLDLDPGIPSDDYYSTLFAVGGDNMRSKLVSLAQKLDADSLQFTDYFSRIDQYTGSITSHTTGPTTVITYASHGLQTGRWITISGNTSTPSLDGTYEVTRIDANQFSINKSSLVATSTGTWITLVNDFRDLKSNFNDIINRLNADAVVSFPNYVIIDNNTIQEAIVTKVNTITKEVTLNLDLEYIVGELTVFNAIDSTIRYSPVTMGDPLTWKHIYESTVMFENKAFTQATVSFSTDLLPAFIEVPFMAQSNGIFGHIQNFGDGFFGGASHAAPFRTYIPRNAQRCRYLNVKFQHKTAREQCSIYGITLTGELTQSTRAYRG